MAQYRKVRTRFWESVHALPLIEKAVAMYCLTAPDSNGMGLYV
jgi:hypothetical protein